VSHPVISAIVPTYNHAVFVTDAVASALAQTIHDLEVIVVDDGSTDDTTERLAGLRHRITYLRQENRGLSAARNTGIAAARGEWIALLDADDVWHPEKSEVQLRVAKRNPDVDLIGSRSTGERMPDHLPIDAPCRRLRVRDFLVSSPMGTTGALIRRKRLNEVGPFDERLRAAEDRDMWLRFVNRFPALQIESPCWLYRQHEGQMNRDVNRMFENYRSVLEKFFDGHPQHSSLKRLAWSHLHLDTAVTYARLGRPRDAWRHVLRSMFLYPWPMGDRNPGRRFYREKFAALLLLRPLRHEEGQRRLTQPC
jgi:glycosyltransferase involved in cell wall biosynthesis